MFDDKIQTKLQELVNALGTRNGSSYGIVQKDSNSYIVRYNDNKAALYDAYTLFIKLKDAGLVNGGTRKGYTDKGGMDLLARELCGTELKPRSLESFAPSRTTPEVVLCSNITIGKDNKSGNFKLEFIYYNRVIPTSAVVSRLENAIAQAKLDAALPVRKPINLSDRNSQYIETVKKYLERKIYQDIAENTGNNSQPDSKIMIEYSDRPHQFTLPIQKDTRILRLTDSLRKVFGEDAVEVNISQGSIVVEGRPALLIEQIKAKDKKNLPSPSEISR